MIFIIALFVLANCQFHVKNLAGPPDEFELHRIPAPATISTRSSFLNLWFNTDASEDGALLSSTRFPVDGSDEFVITFASPVASNVRIELLGPDGKPVDNKKIEVEMSEFELDDDHKNNVPATGFIVNEVVHGFYTFNIYAHGITTSQLKGLKSNPHPDGVLTFVVNDDVQLHSQLQSYVFRVGSEIGIRASVGDGVTLTREDAEVVHALMEVTAPDGSTIDVKMKDDGLSGDLVANDGIYGASIKATQAGAYIVQANLDGFLSNPENPFQRTTQHLIKISDSTLRLVGKASVTPKDESHVTVSLHLNSGASNTNLRAYAEVYGTDATGSFKPACWIGGIVLSTASGTADLILDTKWLVKAGVQGPLLLKNVYIADLDTSFPIDDAATDYEVENSETIVLDLSHTDIPITREMLQGVRTWVAPAPLNASEASPDLLCLPGYCADVNPWTRDSTKFHNSYMPVDKGNYNNNQYSQKMLKQAEDKKMSSYGLVGHSQGGMVSLHILNYYQSGADQAKGARLVQSVGTPYQGSTAAGSAASLGNIFGIGCGSNTDLSLDGAKNWLAGISSASRNAVHFYTTTYEQGRFFGDWCSFAMNAMLQWPNDGVVELQYANLVGGKSMGNKQKWCHTTDMTYPPQYDDAQRNAEINSYAAR